jgi:hypothetical protein
MLLLALLVTAVLRRVSHLPQDLGLRLKELGKWNKVVYGGRGAVAAEWTE